MGYIYLCGAILLEIAGTTLMKCSIGFSKLFYAIGCLLSYALCFYCLSKSLLTVPLSVAYATWCALGIILSTLVAIFAFNEQLSGPGILGVAFIVVGVVLINFFGVPH